MPFHVELEFASKTDTGLVRSHNEDAIAISPQCRFAILADGMGGYSAGEIASSIATSVLKEALEAHFSNRTWNSRFNRTRRLHQIIADSIAHTNTSIIEAAKLEPSYSGMGTTLVTAVFHYDNVTIAHIGDSRVYRLRDDEIVQLTRDHSLLQEQIDAGLVSEHEAQFSQNRNLITRAMGVDNNVEVEMQDYATRLGDIYVLCSDGLSDMLRCEDIVNILATYHADLNIACNFLVAEANVNGGKDNISVVLIKVKSKTRDVPKVSRRIWESLKARVF
jgi:protein phosphatase